MCSYLLSSKKSDDKALSREPWASRKLREVYSKALSFSIAHTKMMLISVGVLLLVSMGLFFTLGRSFLPPFNEGSLTVNVATLRAYRLKKATK